jgi:hypothetical protein
MIARLGLGKPPTNVRAGDFAGDDAPSAIPQIQDAVCVVAFVITKWMGPFEIMVIVFKRCSDTISLKVGYSVLANGDRLGCVDRQPILGRFRRAIRRPVISHEYEFLIDPFT